ncbi:peptidoglycan-associated lipoprotein Pal [Halorhodospira halochloris]|uniref:peptidoglycan-associated lipoprotein Pal n=1 Tax=Halorhodospira halochloris TaxID=1052 RepID=UPI001EE7D44C|nr:peptidoglycan-associated lipoprotein Pal [Halorhodospira halochloris]MCG5531455.1 peptidoglycan-associated lipoprotein Pal [Halorhodospira halochloris]
MNRPDFHNRRPYSLRYPIYQPALAITLTAILLGGCAAMLEEPPPEDDLETEEVEETPIAAEEPEGEPAAEAEGLDEEDLERREEAEARGLDLDDPLDAAMLEDPDEQENPLAVRRIHFAFDSSEIRDEFIPVIEAHGAYLADHPERSMTIEGHTDERGSREYNLALGERRAESVMRLLVANGANRDQLEIVSYGEEDPLVAESNEEAWAENRRAELLYEGRD